MKALGFLLVAGSLLIHVDGAWAQAGWYRSAQSGPWSKAQTWETGSVPGPKAKVQIREGHTVTYDLASGPLIRFIHVAGTLTFARDRDTCLDVCLLKIQPGHEATEAGAHCDAHFTEVAERMPRPALEVGSAENPIPAQYTARIRLTYINGLDRDSLPAILCCGGRMDFHGAPLSRSWVKLGAIARRGDTSVTLAEEVTGWKVGDKLVITATQSARGTDGTRRPGARTAAVETEERTINQIEGGKITLDQPLEHEHKGTGEFRGEVANLSRNVIVESADPRGVRGHTMYHRGSAGAISYAEFRHLGKEGVLGRYSIHFHLCGNSMRGSYVQGASIWDSHNRWITVHGTNFMVVRDCVGYQSVGHGFFLEDGTEIYNVLDRNLAIQAYVGRKLPGQALPFDANDGAGFWWANSFNAFTRNVTCENDRYGYRFEATRTSTFNLNLPILLPDGNREVVDIRILPFIRFENNEAHCDGRYGFNLGEGVALIGPDSRHPFIIRNMKIWEVHYAFRPQSPSILVENMHIAYADYGVYHPNYDHHVYKNLTITDTQEEPFNRGHDDDSVQYGPLTVDGLTFADLSRNGIPMIQISDDNPFGAETHIRNLKIVRPRDQGKRAVVNLGGGTRPEPTTPTCVPVYIHDYFGPGRDAKIVSTKSRALQTDGLEYTAKPPLTGDSSRVADLKDVPFPKLLDPVDEMMPGTIITHVTRAGSSLVVRGTTTDNGTVSQVLVNGVKARALQPNFAEWEAILKTSGAEMHIEAFAEDAAGNVEKTPHRVKWLPR
ncbi:MAG TPA: G8 domain-containing protein [Gemmataceae bacterium]|jgi:hypothetical protein|nr:G8 domain-containing protein [Gemmataceae bacterium]